METHKNSNGMKTFLENWWFLPVAIVAILTSRALEFFENLCGISWICFCVRRFCVDDLRRRFDWLREAPSLSKRTILYVWPKFGAQPDADILSLGLAGVFVWCFAFGLSVVVQTIAVNHITPMEQPERKLCDKCHERPAVSNICYGSGSDEGRSLCEICLKQDLEVGGLMQRMNEAIRNGQCKYCGAPAETMWGGSSSVLGDNFNLVCMTCFNDLTEFVRRPENAALFDFTSEDEAAVRKRVTQLADFMKRKEEFITQQVLKRKSKG